MKVALTVWENRISPVFDSAKMLLIAKIEDDKILNKDYERLNPELPAYFINTMTQLGISTMICGAISQTPAGIIERAGINLIPFISGNVDAILACLSKGVPITPDFLMPGCKKQRRGHRAKQEWVHCKKEAEKMPRGDGSGPDGRGPGSGRGRGGCKTPGMNNTGRNTRAQEKGRGGGQGKGRGNRRPKNTGQ